MAVARTGSFTLAAAQLYVSQPALSQSIQRFEHEIGMTVFSREKGQLRLTEAGSIVVEEGEKLLEAEQRIYDRLKSLKEKTPNRITIGAASSYQRFLLPDVLTELQPLYPDLQIRIEEGFSHSLCRQVGEGKLDFSLAFGPFEIPVQAVSILDEEVFLAVSPQSPLNDSLSQVPDEGSPFPVADLSLCREEPFILYPQDRRIQRILMEETGRAGFTPKAAITGYSTEAANSMAYSGMGLAFVPAVTARLARPGTRPRYYRIRPGGYFRTLYLISRADPVLTGIAKVLLSLLKKQDAKLRG